MRVRVIVRQVREKVNFACLVAILLVKDSRQKWSIQAK